MRKSLMYFSHFIISFLLTVGLVGCGGSSLSLDPGDGQFAGGGNSEDCELLPEGCGPAPLNISFTVNGAAPNLANPPVISYNTNTNIFWNVSNADPLIDRCGLYNSADLVDIDLNNPPAPLAQGLFNVFHSLLILQDRQLTLLCGRKDYSPVREDFAVNSANPTSQIVFITSTAYQGNFLAGKTLEDADIMCEQHAVNLPVGLQMPGRDWKAILSTSAQSAGQRIVQYAPIYNRPGDLVFALGELFVRTIPINTIRFNELGNNPGGDAIWTGTNTDGTTNGNHCSNWGSTSGNGAFADSQSTQFGRWIIQESASCSNSKNFYCISQ